MKIIALVTSLGNRYRVGTEEESQVSYDCFKSIMRDTESNGDKWFECVRWNKNVLRVNGRYVAEIEYE